MKPGAFAKAVAGRHGAAPGRLSRSVLVLRGSRRASPRHGIAGARHVHHHRSVRVVLNFRHLELGQRGSPVVHSTVQAAPLPPRIVARTAPRTVSVTRVEHRVPVPGRTAARAASAPDLVPRRAAQIEAMQETRPTPRLETAQVRERFQVQPQPVPTALPRLELERVTDHVLRSLDRRMSSWRDRRGRT